MIRYEEIRDVHLEVSTFCNARCPWCPRNFWGFPYNGGYPEIGMTIDDAKQIFNKEFLQQLDSIRFNGNFGDIVMNSETVNIVKYFLECNPDLYIVMHTNGSARSKQFWAELGKCKVTIWFALDGLEDTHHLYRQNTSFNQILKNAETFMSAGGTAIWQMIKFKHNQHQVDECQKLSKQLGFSKFELIESSRDSAPVFDKNGNLSHLLGDYAGETDLVKMIHSKKTDEILLEDITVDKTPGKKINCKTKELKSIFISANGDVYPCCWTGFYPKTYGAGQYHQAANSQLIPLISENNAVVHDIKDCIKWFNKVESCWSVEKYENGRLIICDDNCGS